MKLQECGINDLSYNQKRKHAIYCKIILAPEYINITTNVILGLAYPCA